MGWLRNWLFKPPKPEPWLQLFPQHRGWADSLKGHAKRDFAIQLGLFAAGKGAGYDLEVTRLDKSKYVYEPCEFLIEASYCSSISCVDNTEALTIYKFKVKCESYTIQNIVKGVMVGIEDACKIRKKINA